MSRFSLAELERRMTNIIRVATIASVNANAARCTVSIDELTTSELPWLTSHAGQTRTWWTPEVGEQVIVLSPFGDLAQGFVLQSLYQTTHPAPDNNPAHAGIHFKDGSLIEYDDIAHRLKINLPATGSDILITSAGTLNITTDKDTTVNADNAIVNATTDVVVTAGGKATVDAPSVALNGGAGVVTKACICALTGLPHSDGSSTVTAGK